MRIDSAHNYNFIHVHTQLHEQPRLRHILQNRILIASDTLQNISKDIKTTRVNQCVLKAMNKETPYFRNPSKLTSKQSTYHWLNQAFENCIKSSATVPWQSLNNFRTTQSGSKCHLVMPPIFCTNYINCKQAYLQTQWQIYVYSNIGIAICKHISINV